MPIKNFYPKKKRVYKKKTYAKRKPMVTKSVKTYVKKALDKRIENKEVVIQNQAFGIYQNGASTITGPLVQSVSPVIVQGVGENGRIGNTVKIKNVFLRGYLTPSPTTIDTRTPNIIGQWNVRIFIGRLKNAISGPTTADFNTLMRTGAATQAFDSANGLSLCRTVNTEVFTVYYDKIHKIGFQNGNNLSVATGLHNNDFKLNKQIRINCTRMMKKTLIFQEGNNSPQNTALFMWAGICDSLCSGYTNSSPLVNFIYDLEYSYEDA